MNAAIARALVWLQWRMVINRLTRSAHRDDLERASRWGEVVLRTILAALAIPVALGAAAAAVFGGWHAARVADGALVVAIAAGATLVIPLVWMLLRPVTMLSTGGVERAVLLRLLPISPTLLRNAEAVRTMADPVVLVLVPAILLLPVGALAGGKLLLALATLLGGIGFVALVALLGNLVTLAAQLLLRGRRRAEIVTLAFLVVISTAGLLPQLFAPAHQISTPAEPTGRHRAVAGPEDSAAAMPVLARALPPVAYGSVILDGAAGRWPAAAGDVAAITAWVIALYLLAVPIYDRLTTTPEAGARQRAAGGGRVRLVRLPFVSPATTAVAVVEGRALLRTVRGKMALVYPGLMTAVFAAMLTRHDAGPSGLHLGPFALGAVAVFASVANSGAFACNQFGLHGGGFILELLLPLPERTLAAGKTIATGAIVATALSLALVAPAVLFPAVSPAVWIAFLLAGLSAHVAATPVAIVLSALFPKPAELSRIGRAGQPNALSSLLYLLAAAVASAPAAGAILVGLRVAHSPWLATALVLGYAAIAVAWAHVGSGLAARIVVARRENLALVAIGR